MLNYNIIQNYNKLVGDLRFFFFKKDKEFSLQISKLKKDRITWISATFKIVDKLLDKDEP